MKKTSVLLVMLMIPIGLSACTNPLVNEQLFCVSKDIAVLHAEGSLQLDGESVVLEVKNNKTKEVLCSRTWADNEDADVFLISLENVKKEEEYVISFRGSEIIQAAVEITFASNLVHERAAPIS